ncbi:hypothetical protein [Litorilituus sediminis]|uniref:DUF4412 domain-containing protein n=1 Tax=Litorilituus sediminis TaxID=718192 RepID=A0A4P6P5G6_9GAMM|nr:hypothetical protein [Litorilituus sediminis]QBG36916.1 hypothetical protein EMK97_14895 [Litorilituus sediminis]
MKNLMTLAFTLGSALLASSAQAQSCANDKLYLSANYEISQRVADSHTRHDSHTHEHAHDKGQSFNKQQLVLHRYNNQVVHMYPDSHYGDWWTKTANNRLMLNRFFPDNQRVIEYQADELSSKISWQSKYQLLNSDFINNMVVVKETGTGCEQSQQRALTQGDYSYQLTWLPKWSLVTSYQVFRGDEKVAQWQLVNYQVNKKHIADYIAKLSDYRATDYADIGDNENDPFLAKMINQGFVEHKATGFYNSQGDNISKQHSH